LEKKGVESGGGVDAGAAAWEEAAMNLREREVEDGHGAERTEWPCG
jgi:hypothetical protein